MALKKKEFLLRTGWQAGEHSGIEGTLRGPLGPIKMSIIFPVNFQYHLILFTIFCI